jgi:hypothetical protein
MSAQMSRNGSASSYQGFSVFQPALGSSLQFVPALGTPELDAAIDAYIPGSASIQDKRMAVTMDFFEYTQRTGETFKCYPVFSAATTSSPASTMYDSGYGSNFNASPVVSASSWGPASFTSPSSSSQTRKTSERKQSVASRTTANDFSHIPGMKIMTKDGQDVTNSASRGCKTKEQRDHAHLMRIIKACDACRRKKIRCDPSHKKRSASQSQSSEAKPTKKIKKAPAETRYEPTDFLDQDLLLTSFDMSDVDMSFATPDFPATQDNWDQFVHYDDEPFLSTPFDYTFYSDSLDNYSPTSGSSTSPPQPFTPAPGATGSVEVFTGSLLPELDSQQATLPYLQTGPHGTNYVDFNLFSPPSSVIDEEPEQLQVKARGTSQRQSTQRSISSPRAGQSRELRPTPECPPDGYLDSLHQTSRSATDLGQICVPHTGDYGYLSTTDAVFRPSSLGQTEPTSVKGHNVSALTAVPSRAHSADEPTLEQSQSASVISGTGNDGLSSQSPRSPETQELQRRPTVSSTLLSAATTAATVRQTVLPRERSRSHRHHDSDCGDRDGQAATRGLRESPRGDYSTSRGVTTTDTLSAPLRTESTSVSRLQTRCQTQPGDQSDNRRRLQRPEWEQREGDLNEGRSISTPARPEQDYVAAVINLASTPTWSGASLMASPTVRTTQSPGLAVSYGPREHSDLPYYDEAPSVLQSPSCSALLAAILLLMLPMRQMMDAKTRSSGLFSVVVAVGLVSLLAAFVLQSNSLAVAGKLALSAIPLAIRHEVPAKAGRNAWQDTIDNVKSKIQAAAAKAADLGSLFLDRQQRASASHHSSSNRT